MHGELPDFMESPADGQMRFATTIREIYHKIHTTQNVLIIGHGDSINAVGYGLTPGIIIYDTQECCFLLFDAQTLRLVDYSRLAICAPD